MGLAERLAGQWRIVHPFPTVAVTAAAAGFGWLAAGRDAPGLLLLAGAVFASQVAIGSLNDYLDRDHDAVEQPEKPIPSGLLPPLAHWAVGGHSLGGVMAAHYAHDHPRTVQGLALWAAYPQASDDLSGSALSVVSISGSLDGLSTPAKIAASRPLLPASTTWVVIAGGDHGQFGWYGPQSGDNPATLDHAAQSAQTVAATVALLAALR